MRRTIEIENLLKRIRETEAERDLAIKDRDNALKIANMNHAMWERATTWQPIDTAPKNGSDVPCIGSWYQFPAMLRWDRDEWRDWNSNVLHPTHWFALPEFKP